MGGSNNSSGRLLRLESLRGLAALYVFLSHAVREFVPGEPRWTMFSRFGYEAVTLFFILSGFVIYYSTLQGARRGGARGFRDYFVRRARRIYPLFAIALLLAYGVACVRRGMWVDPDWRTLVGNLFMLQDFAQAKPGCWFPAYCDNGPLWSLAYEWWFYMLFYPIATRVPGAWQKWVVAGISGAALGAFMIMPNQPSLYLMNFIVWWAGVELAREFADHGVLTWRRQAPSIAVIGAASAAWGVYAFAGSAGVRSLGTHPILELRQFVGALVMLVGGIAWYKLRFVGFGVSVGWLRVLAPVSYGLYILHFPLVTWLSATQRWMPWPVGIAITLAITVALSYLTEVLLQRWINRRTDWLLRRGRAPATPAPIVPAADVVVRLVREAPAAAAAPAER